MLTFLRTNSTHQDFISLVRHLDIELATIDGDEHSFYVQYNKIDKINHVIIAYENELPIACGAIKQFSENTMEVKRMYILAPYRGKGTASGVLVQLEKWAAEMNYSHCILETGIRQPDAIRLYGKNGYLPIPNYGQYAGVENNLCFEKAL